MTREELIRKKISLLDNAVSSKDSAIFNTILSSLLKDSAAIEGLEDEAPKEAPGEAPGEGLDEEPEEDFEEIELVSIADIPEDFIAQAKEEGLGEEEEIELLYTLGGPDVFKETVESA